MDDDKKKRKNKKKKNRQTKTTEDLSVCVKESASADENHVNGIEQNHQSRAPETGGVQNDAQKSDTDLDGQRDNGTEGANLEGKINLLQKEMDEHLQKEAHLESNILQLQSEKDLWLLKEVSFEGKIKQLERERDSLVEREVSLEGKIKQLERERDSLVERESSTKETIACLNGGNTRLQEQVMELEESRNNLIQENQQLIDNLSVAAHSSTESTLGADNEAVLSQMKAAQELVEKLLSENTELVEKVNELYVELDRRMVTELPSSVGSDPLVGTANSEQVDESSAHISDPMTASAEIPESDHVAGPVVDSSKRMMSESGDRVESLEDVTAEYKKDGGNYANPAVDSRSLEDVTLETTRDGGNYVNSEGTAVSANPPETIESDEIVPIPLDENEIQDAKMNPSHNVEKVEVPISDAPLIGAPFRLISFVARYVSGADLVNKSCANTDR